MKDRVVNVEAERHDGHSDVIILFGRGGERRYGFQLTLLDRYGPEEVARELEEIAATIREHS